MKKLTLEMAFDRFLDEFLKLHPQESLPEWFRLYTNYEAKKDMHNNWIISFTAIEKESLSENEFLEDGPNNSKVIFRIDPIAHNKEYLLSKTTEKKVVIFEAIINAASGEVKVLTDTDFMKLDKSKLLQIGN